MPKRNDSAPYDAYCSALDNWSDLVSVNCNVMRACLAMRGHDDAFRDWDDADLTRHPAGRAAKPSMNLRLNTRAQRTLAQYIGAGFEPSCQTVPLRQGADARQVRK